MRNPTLKKSEFLENQIFNSGLVCHTTIIIVLCCNISNTASPARHSTPLKAESSEEVIITTQKQKAKKAYESFSSIHSKRWIDFNTDSD